MAKRDYTDLPLSPGLSKRLDVQNHLAKQTRFETIIYWLISSDARERTHLHNWFVKTLKETDLIEVVNEVRKLNPKIDSTTNYHKVRTVLKFVNSKIKYVTDNNKWKLLDKWQTPTETWESKTGDCEDGALLIYYLCRELGVPDVQLRIVCGNVSGGGHAYVVWRSDENSLEYPIDWCYWYNESIKLNIPHSLRSDYFYGALEWFSFNSTNMYKGTKVK